jgi:RNA polymerase sigma-70 factor, ECF subfamily
MLASRVDGFRPPRPLNFHMLFSLATSSGVSRSAGIPPRVPPRAELDFERLYEDYFAFVWRSLRRLGVDPSLLDDASQDTFVVVFRRVGDFRGASSVRTWLFGIVLRVAKDYRRRATRKPTRPLEQEPPAPPTSGPEALTEAREAAALLGRLLDELDETQRAVFVLAELEQMSAPEIAEALDVKVNTVYSRLRTARRSFTEALARHRARRSP